MVKNPSAWKRHWFDFWVGKIPWRRAWQSTTIFLPEDGQRSLVGCSPRGHKQSDTTEGLSTFQYLLGSDSRASAPDSPCDPHTAERNWSLALVCVAPRNRSTLLANHLPSFKGPHVFHSGKGLFWLHWMCRRTRGTEGSFMHQSHKQITNYATEPLKVLPFCFSIRGALSVAWGAWGTTTDETIILCAGLRASSPNPLSPSRPPAFFHCSSPFHLLLHFPQGSLWCFSIKYI